MKAVVDFLRMPVALSTGEYPLLTSLDQNLAAYIVESVTLNVRKDLAQTIRTVDFMAVASISWIFPLRRSSFLLDKIQMYVPIPVL